MPFGRCWLWGQASSSRRDALRPSSFLSQKILASAVAVGTLRAMRHPRQRRCPQGSKGLKGGRIMHRLLDDKLPLYEEVLQNHFFSESSVSRTEVQVRVILTVVMGLRGSLGSSFAGLQGTGCFPLSWLIWGRMTCKIGPGCKSVSAIHGHSHPEQCKHPLRQRRQHVLLQSNPSKT